MKVIFVDFDGVLNTEKYVLKFAEFGLIIDPIRMELLKQIVDASDAKIVLSTSWREHWDAEPDECDDIGIQINEIFSKHGMSVLDKTPLLNCNRENEIEEWLGKNPQVKNFVVLDDRFLDSKTIRDHFVKTSGYSSGLNEECTQKAIEILMR